MSPRGVRLSGAPGAPFWVGYSSANRALAGKLLWDGIVAVPEVFGAGCLALSPVRRVRAALPSGRFPTHLPGDCGIWRHTKAARIDLTPMLTHTFRLDEWRDAFTVLADQETSGAIKVAIDSR